MQTRIIILFLAAGNAWASVDDGIRAFYNGDYERAIELLSEHGSEPRAQRYLGQIYDRNYHSLWEFASRRDGVSVYSGGVEHDIDKMLAHYDRAIQGGDMIARYLYCDWVASPLWQRGSYLRDSGCKRVRNDFKTFAKARPDDPVVAFYHWIVRSGDRGTADRRERAKELLLPGARLGNPVHQYYLGQVFMGFNPRPDRPADHDNAFAWFTAAATNGNYHARVMRTFLEKLLEADDGLASAEKRAQEILDSLTAGDPSAD